MRNILIEAQQIAPSERHNFIFSTFDCLETGESLTIINNHDPKPLLIQFNEMRTNLFITEYLMEGPQEWKVKLTKKMKEGCCGCC